jgi:transcriptional regulator with XRE-family HTH domain
LIGEPDQHWSTRMPDTVLHRFAARLQNLRKDQNLTQAALAARAGLHVGYVNALENAHQIPSLDTLERLAKGLKVALKMLVDFPESAGRKGDRAKGEIAQILGRLEHADLDTLKKIRKVVEAMTS